MDGPGLAEGGGLCCQAGQGALPGFPLTINTWFKTQQMAYSLGFMLSSRRRGSQ